MSTSLGKRDTYRGLIERYQPLLRALNDAETARAHEIANQFMHDERGTRPALDATVYHEACRLISDEGLFMQSTSETPVRLTASFLERLAYQEIHALIATAAITVAESEAARKKPFRDDQLPEMMMKAMQELYVGKKYIQTHERDGSAFTR